MFRKSGSALALALLLAMGMPLQAHAKGPESATLAGPGISEPIELISVWKSFDTYKNDAPIQLTRMTGLWTGHLLPADKAPSKTGPAYTLTWGNSGYPGEPVTGQTIYQYIYLDAAGGPLIHTPHQTGLAGWGDEVIGWFEAPKGLGVVIDEVIAWSTTAEAAELQSTKASAGQIGKLTLPVVPVAASSNATPDPAPAPIWLVIVTGIGVGGLAIWCVRQTRRPDASSGAQGEAAAGGRA